MAIHGKGIPAIFDVLHHNHALPTDDAFDVAVRALRGGGLTKDAVYLRGLRDLLADLRAGGDFSALFAGKFALAHRGIVAALIDDGWVAPPRLLPRYASAEGFAEVLERCRDVDVARLHHPHPLPLPLEEQPA